ncbi:MAG: hypothetical protein ABIJ09_17600 [Pseudomonadota bacterium]
MNPTTTGPAGPHPHELSIHSTSVEQAPASPGQQWEDWSGSLAMALAPVLTVLLILSHFKRVARLLGSPEPPFKAANHG